MVNRTSSPSKKRQLALDALLTDACNNLELDKISLSVSMGANVNSIPVNGYGNTLNHLMFAIHHNSFEVAKALVLAGADVNELKYNPYVYATLAPLHLAIIKSNDDIELIKLLILKGADIDCVGSKGTPIIAAIEYREIECVRLLIDKGAKLKIEGNFICDAYRAAKMHDHSTAMLFGYGVVLLPMIENALLQKTSAESVLGEVVKQSNPRMRI